MKNVQKIEILETLRFEGKKSYTEIVMQPTFPTANALYKNYLYGPSQQYSLNPYYFTYNLNEFWRLGKLMKFGEKIGLIKIDRTNPRKWRYEFVGGVQK